MPLLWTVKEKMPFLQATKPSVIVIFLNAVISLLCLVMFNNLWSQEKNLLSISWLHINLQIVIQKAEFFWVSDFLRILSHSWAEGTSACVVRKWRTCIRKKRLTTAEQNIQPPEALLSALQIRIWEALEQRRVTAHVWVYVSVCLLGTFN